MCHSPTRPLDHWLQYGRSANGLLESAGATHDWSEKKNTQRSSRQASGLRPQQASTLTLCRCFYSIESSTFVSSLLPPFRRLLVPAQSTSQRHRLLSIGEL